MRKLFLALVFFLSLYSLSSAAPSYGTKMPEKNKFFAGFESYSLFKRYLEDGHGKLRSQQQFYGMSYGVFDWLSIDAKAGGGNIRQHPVGSDEIDYPTSFAGGYGFRVRLLDRSNWKMVFGFQHISVHPKSVHLGEEKNSAILDDWQTSLLASYSFKRITPYLGTRWSRVDYIHKVNGERKRWNSDFTKDIGLIYGFDIPISEKIWLNLEGQALDSDAFAASINYSF
jgi:hypothetical protein